MKKYGLYIVLLLLMFTSCEREVVREFDFDADVNLCSLWSILDERYCYFYAKGIDWNGVYYIYQQRLYNKRQWTVYEYFDLLAQMLDTLQDGHVNLYSPFDVSSCAGWYDDYPTDFYQEMLTAERYLGNNIRRAGGFQYGYLAGTKVGYIRYASFSNGFSGQNLAYIDNYFSDADGIVLDVRTNGGGQLDYSERLAACFFKQRTVTGYIQHKTGKGHNDFSEPQPLYTDPATAPLDLSDRKVVLLTNRRCYSATNDFVVRMLQAPNVTVMGGITGGGGGMPLSQELPNGWMVRFSAVPMYDAKMNHTEFGVEPEVEVHISMDDLAAGHDNILDKAIEYLTK